MFVRTSVRLFRDSKLPSVIPNTTTLVARLDGIYSPKKVDYCNHKSKCSCNKKQNKNEIKQKKN